MLYRREIYKNHLIILNCKILRDFPLKKLINYFGLFEITLRLDRYRRTILSYLKNV